MESFLCRWTEPAMARQGHCQGASGHPLPEQSGQQWLGQDWPYSADTGK